MSKLKRKRPLKKRRREMNEEDLRTLAQQVVKNLRPHIADTPIQLNKNFANNTFKIWEDQDTNGWSVLIGSVQRWHPHAKFLITLNDFLGWNIKQFAYCVYFSDEKK